MTQIVIKNRLPGAEKTVVFTRLYAIDKKTVYMGFRKCFETVFYFFRKIKFFINYFDLRKRI
jgi:hypothetical protein